MSGLIVNDNIASMQAQNTLNRTQDAMAQSIRRLSSGHRVESPKDDPAGYAISQRMSGQVLSYKEAMRNAADGNNLLNTASGALQTSNTILLKMRELAIQASNSTNSHKDRVVLNQEYNNLKNELTRISKVTDFNGMKLLDGSHKSFEFQVGIGTSPDNALKVKMGRVDATTLGLTGTGLLSREAAQKAIRHADKALDQINDVQGSIGAIQNRMQWTLRNLNAATTNVQASRAGIRDANFAQETANYTKERILSQAGTAVLSQANTMPKAALNLLA